MQSSDREFQCYHRLRHQILYTFENDRKKNGTIFTTKTMLKTQSDSSHQTQKLTYFSAKYDI